MKKICHITSVHPSRDVRIFHKMCKSLAGAGYETHLLAPGESFTEDGVQVTGMGPRRSFKERVLFTNGRYKRATLRLDADLYHIHDPELLPLAKLLKRRGKRVIFDSHEFYGLQIRSKTWVPKIIRTVVAPLYERYEAGVCRKIDQVVAVCTVSGKNYFEKRARRLCYITNAPLLSEFGEVPEPAIRPQEAVCYIGSLTQDRGISHLVEACEKAGIRLILGGNFSIPRYGEEVKQMSGWNNVEYLGYIGRDKVQEVLAASMAGMSTLLNSGQYLQIDTLPVKVYEYMAAGLPVIVSASPYLQDFMEKAQCGLCVAPEDTNAIAEAITFLKDNPDKALEMAENGFRLIREELNWSVEEAKLLDIYETLLSVPDYYINT